MAAIVVSLHSGSDSLNERSTFPASTNYALCHTNEFLANWLNWLDPHPKTLAITYRLYNVLMFRLVFT